jgi:hypothetical protein
VFVIELAVLQAVVKLAEEFVEQVSLGLVVPVSGGAAGIEVAARARRGAQRSQRPDRADGSQPPVPDMAMQHNGFLATGTGDRSRSSEGFQPAGVSEAGAVIADLGKHPGAGQHSQAGEAGDDLGVRVLLKMGDRRLGQLVGGRAPGVELAQQCSQLDADRGFHHRRLVQVSVGEHDAQPLDVSSVIDLLGRNENDLFSAPLATQRAAAAVEAVDAMETSQRLQGVISRYSPPTANAERSPLVSTFCCSVRQHVLSQPASIQKAKSRSEMSPATGDTATGHR